MLKNLKENVAMKNIRNMEAKGSLSVLKPNSNFEPSMKNKKLSDIAKMKNAP